MFGRILATLIGAALAAAPIIAQAAAPLRPVAAQAGESSCGSAALANLLTWAGFPVAEVQLEAIMRQRVLDNDPAAIARYRDQGASGTELVRLVAALDAGFELKAELATIEAARSLAGREAYIAFLIDAATGGQMRSHFTIVAGYDPARGWLRADSIDGRHIWQKDADFGRAALVQRDQTRVLVLRLIRSGRTAVPAEDPDTLAAAQVPWIATSRLLTGAARTRSPVASLSIAHSRASFEADGLALREHGLSVVAALSYPLTRNLVGSISVPYRNGRTSIGIPGVADFDLGKSSGVGPIGLRLTRRFDVSGVMAGWISSSIDVRTTGQPAGIAITGGLERALGTKAMLSAGAGLDVQRGDDAWEPSVGLSASLVRMVGKRSSVTFDAAASIPLRRTSPTLTLGLGFDRQVSNTLAIGISSTWSVTGPARFRSRTFGFNIVKRLPNK